MTDETQDAALLDPASVGSIGRGLAATAGLTCWWACVITAGLAVLGAVVTAFTDLGSVWIMVMVWMIVALLTWVVGWPAGWLTERLLDRAQASAVRRAVVFAVVGAVLAVPITVYSPVGMGAPLVVACFAVAGALGAGGGRWIVVVRARRLTLA